MSKKEDKIIAKHIKELESNTLFTKPKIKFDMVTRTNIVTGKNETIDKTKFDALLNAESIYKEWQGWLDRWLLHYESFLLIDRATNKPGTLGIESLTYYIQHLALPEVMIHNYHIWGVPVEYCGFGVCNPESPTQPLIFDVLKNSELYKPIADYKDIHFINNIGQTKVDKDNNITELPADEQRRRRKAAFEEIYHREYLKRAIDICNDGFREELYKAKGQIKKMVSRTVKPTYDKLYSQSLESILIPAEIQDGRMRGDLKLNKVWPELEIRNVSVTRTQAWEVLYKCQAGIDVQSKDKSRLIRIRYENITIEDREIIYSKSFRQHKSTFISNLFENHETIKDREQHYTGFYAQLKNRSVLPVIDLLKFGHRIYKPNSLMVGWFEASFLMWVSKAHPSQQVETQLIGNEGAKLMHFVLTDRDYESSISKYWPLP